MAQGRSFYFEACEIKTKRRLKEAQPSLENSRKRLRLDRGHETLVGPGKGLVKSRAQGEPRRNEKEVCWMVWGTPCSLWRTKKIHGGLSEVSGKLLLESARSLYPRGCVISLHPNTNLTITFKLLHAWALWRFFLETLQKSPLLPATTAYTPVCLLRLSTQISKIIRSFGNWLRSLDDNCKQSFLFCSNNSLSPQRQTHCYLRGSGNRWVFPAPRELNF